MKILLITLLTGLGLASARAADRPNVVYIMADDLGIGDVECYGKERCQIDTPNIDSLAREGMLFSDAHSVSSHCIPVRVSIMTGRYPWRLRTPRVNGPWGFLNPRIPLGHRTLGNMLAERGYHTGYIGKWHLGTVMPTKDGENQGLENVDYARPLEVGPRDYGFDYSFILPGSLDMYPYVFVRNHQFVGDVTVRKGWSAFNRVGPAEESFEDYKVLDTLSQEAEEFIGRNAASARGGTPFFLYFALTSPHTPTCPSPAFQGKSRLGLYGDFVMETDDCVGRVLRALDRHGVKENTMVIFTSDHGAALYAGNVRKATKNGLRELEKQGHYSSGVHQGYKFSIYEGGLRVPYLVRWPGTVEAGSRCDRLVSLNDLMRTLAEIGGHEPATDEAPDSFSYYRLLKDPQGEGTRESIVMQSASSFAIRVGDWKLALCPGSGCAGHYGNVPPSEEAWARALQEFKRRPSREDIQEAPFVQLFDMRTDLGETNNLAAARPEVVGRLVKRLDSEIAKGRSTPGPRLQNDVERIDYHAAVPGFVLRK